MTSVQAMRRLWTQCILKVEIWGSEHSWDRMGSQVSIPRLFTSTAWGKDDAKLMFVNFLFVSVPFDEDHATYRAAPWQDRCPSCII